MFNKTSPVFGLEWYGVILSWSSWYIIIASCKAKPSTECESKQVSGSHEWWSMFQLIAISDFCTEYFQARPLLIFTNLRSQQSANKIPNPLTLNLIAVTWIDQTGLIGSCVRVKECNKYTCSWSRWVVCAVKQPAVSTTAIFSLQYNDISDHDKRMALEVHEHGPMCKNNIESIFPWIALIDYLALINPSEFIDCY